MSSDSERPLAVEAGPSGSGLSDRLMSAPGGHLWWYLDLIDDDGDGLVVIWSFGLPFLPGYIEAARRGRPQLPESRPSLNVATYRDGRLDFYLLREFAPAEADWETTDRGDRWRFDRSRIESLVEDHHRIVELDLRLAIPGTATEARLQVTGRGPRVRRPGQSHDPSRRQTDPLPDHDWVPLTTGCNGEATLTIGAETQSWSGRLYHDRNGGRRPLTELNIDRWMWGRVALPDRDFIYYVVDADTSTQSLLWTVDDRGRARPLEGAQLHRDDHRRNLTGLNWWSSMTIEVDGEIWLEIRHRDVVDSGPFYLRTLPEATPRRATTHRGVAEICEPDRIDLPHFRPLIRMRVARSRGSNSVWLPLFCGPRRGRMRRLFSSLADQLLPTNDNRP